MKNIIIIVVLFFAALSLQAQGAFPIVQGEPVYIYSLPKTELIFEVEVEKTIQKPGRYYQYAERYLATNQIILEEKTNYRLKNIKLNCNAMADSLRTYSIPANKYNNQITVNSKGLLCGVNVPVIETDIATKPTHLSKKTKANTSNNVLPLSEEYLMAGSTAKLAEGAAKQIYRIRESRLSLLTGDLEHMPSDGASLKSMLKELNSMENELTELFIGTKQTETIRHIIRITPYEAMEKSVLFRISALKGLVANNDLSGVPFYLSIKPQTISTIQPDPKAKRTKTAIYTIIPATTSVTLSDGINTLVAEDILMPQFGIVVPIAEELYNQPKIKITVDAKSGRLLSIEK